MTSTKLLLLQHVCPTVDADVAALLAAGASWRQIAAAVSATSGITVSHTSMRAWFGTVERVA